VVLDVTAFYRDDTPAISGLTAEQREEFGVRRLDTSRSFINYARSFPRNVDVRNTLTFEATTPPSNESTGTISMEMHHSMVLLPAVPMRPRYADARVGFFSVEHINFGLPEQKAATQTFIRRWRLEPKDPAAYARGELVEPVKPIVYYLDPATPPEYRSCVRQGIEDWQAAFETAGFRNAILAKDAPTPEQDPAWDAADARYSVVRWAASLTRNAQGPSTSDPRSGEIIESDIVWYHNHLRSYRNRLMIETGATNPLARHLPIDQDLMCEAMRQVIAHEIGHAIGLPHNMVSSSAYPVDSLRSKTFAARMGVAPSVMDYARQNYVAQPGDGLAGADFIRQIGPYDHYAINWGYRVIPGAVSPEAERPILNRWIKQKADDPIYRYLPQSGAGADDPRAQTEDIGADHVKASRYGIANL
ncbi:MAG: zinc-dependent metalloprotease, partial [Longimicrobiales bacterium]